MNAAKVLQAAADLAKFYDALATMPLGGPVLGPRVGQMVLDRHGEVSVFTTTAKTDFGSKRVMVCAVSAFGVPPTPVAAFDLN